MGKGTKVGHDQRDTGSVRLLSGICTHPGHPGHPALSSQPVFKSPCTHSPLIWFGHFPSVLLTASHFTSPKTLTISCSFPPSWAWRQLLGELQWLPTTPSTQISASVPQSAAFPPFLEGNHPWPHGRLLSEDCHPCEPRWIPCCPCHRPPSPYFSTLLFAVHPGKGASPRCSHDFLSSFLQLFAQSLYLWILPDHPVQICGPLPHTSYFLILLYCSC